jgi:hypothetical protein
VAVKFESVNPPADGHKLAALRAELEFEPPDGLLRFLSEHDGARPEMNEVDTSMSGASAGIGVEEFLGVDEIMQTVRQFGGRLQGTIPVAFAEGGNLVCMGGTDGSVWFWDHEREGHDPLSRVADDLDAFLAMLKPFDVGAVEFTDEEKSGWVDPELLREMGIEPKE